MFSVVPNR